MNHAEVLARTLWGEARGEGRRGMEAVACVILNRARNPRWWGNSIAAVCQQPAQFSCWNRGDPNRAPMLAVTASDERYALAQTVAAHALAGTLDDPTGGADHYANLAVASPRWADPRRRTITIGAHTFFRLELPAPPEPAPLLATGTARAALGVGTAAATAQTLPELARAAADAAPALSVLTQLAPLVAVALIVAAVGWFIWKRQAERKASGT